MKRKGFTLIELLVVIAIIAILAAILFPVFAKAREKARQSSCGSNLKQLGAAAMMYLQDYDEKLPLLTMGYPGYWPTAPAGMQNATFSTWELCLRPYMKNYDICLCPSANPNGWTRTGYTQWVMCDYGINYQICSPPQPPTYPSNLNGAVMRCEYPAETILMADNNTTYKLYIFTRWYTLNAAYTKIHNEGSNLNFADGHAKWSRNPAADYYNLPY
jgi:prepilin-type N-terminal cleavage/methylation domain-containing protein/prepilin-type processing-associated H-X9-DG protein